MNYAYMSSQNLSIVAVVFPVGCAFPYSVPALRCVSVYLATIMMSMHVVMSIVS